MSPPIDKLPFLMLLACPRLLSLDSATSSTTVLPLPRAFLTFMGSHVPWMIEVYVLVTTPGNDARPHVWGACGVQ
jgi:hypothetical protein